MRSKHRPNLPPEAWGILGLGVQFFFFAHCMTKIVCHSVLRVFVGHGRVVRWPERGGMREFRWWWQAIDCPPVLSNLENSGYYEHVGAASQGVLPGISVLLYLKNQVKLFTSLWNKPVFNFCWISSCSPLYYLSSE